MKYYSAVVSEEEVLATVVIPPFNILASFHYFKKKADVIKNCLSKNYDVFIDSGAFSAASLGKHIDIDEYCEFIKETGVKRYASLDVMGNAKETLKNYLYMVEKHGLKPIPTFHMGSEIVDLEPILEIDSVDYIALGGLVFSSGIMHHCDEVWSYILKRKPHLKVHGFGLTNIELMKRYPWYSVDSSSYKSCRRFGRQNILWNGMEFKTIGEDEYLDILKQMKFTFGDPQTKEEKTEENRRRYFIYDMQSCQSYKMYAAHLTELNKIKDFGYLKSQIKLFED